MNRERISQLADHIEAQDPTRFSMDDWFSSEEGDTPAEVINHCETTACIGGWALHRFAPNNSIPSHPDEIRDKAARLLGIFDEDSVNELFYAPVVLPNPTRDQVVQLLRTAAATGAIDWRPFLP